MISHEELEARARAIPALPSVATRVLRLLNDPEATIDSMVEAIKLDPGLALRVLRICNSPYYGLSRQVASLHDAVILLGSNAVANIVLSSFLVSTLHRPLAGYGLDAGALWTHSVCCGIAAELAAEKAAPRLMGQAFTAALLHDMGKMVLAPLVEEESANIRQMEKSHSTGFHDAERCVLGFAHTEAGEAMAEHWNLPQPLTHAIRYHHEPLQAPADMTLVCLVHLGDSIATCLGYGMGADGLAKHMSAEAAEHCGLAQSDLLGISALIPDRYEQMQSALEN